MLALGSSGSSGSSPSGKTSEIVSSECGSLTGDRRRPGLITKPQPYQPVDSLWRQPFGRNTARNALFLSASLHASFIAPEEMVAAIVSQAASDGYRELEECLVTGQESGSKGGGSYRRSFLERCVRE